MKVYQAKDIRNVALVGHNTVGKTTIAEAMAFYTGKITRMGTINDGTTISDYSKDEIDKQYSIRSTVLSLEHNDTKFNIIDCPGYADFVGETYSAIRVSDNVLCVVAASNTQGTDVGTENAVEVAKKLKKPVAFFINKCDVENADYDKVVENLKESFSGAVTSLQYPVGKGEDFKGIIDVIDMKMYVVENGKRTPKDIPSEYFEKADKQRLKVVEDIAGTNEELMERYLEEGDLPFDVFKDAFKTAFDDGLICPVLCGSAINLTGIYTLMEYIDKMFVSPLTHKIRVIRNNEEALVPIDENAPTTAFVFKSVSESYIGDLMFLKVTSGILRSGDELYNNGEVEKVVALSFVTGKNKVETKEARAGDIVSVVKLKHTHTNDTLRAKDVDYVVKPLEFPKPLIWEAVKTKNKNDDARIGQALSSIMNEDPTFGHRYDSEIHQTIIHGQGIKHIETVLQKLRERYKIEVDIFEAKIPYRETITTAVEGSYRHKKQSGGKGQFGEVHFKMRPRGRGEGYKFIDSIVGGSIPARFIPAVEKGINETLVTGVISGSQVIDLEVELFFGKFHDVDSSEMAFKIAARMCFKELFKKAKPILLEPIYIIKISCPEEYTGDIMGDITARRGRPEGMDTVGSKQVITAKVPLSELYRYCTTVRTLTQGKGSFEIEFNSYEVVPSDIQQKVVEKYLASVSDEDEE